jgi:hypothetical protein
MIHRRRSGCGPVRAAIFATPWHWAEGMDLETLISEFTAVVGHDPAVRLCGHCFGRNERAAWFSRVQTRPAP